MFSNKFCDIYQASYFVEHIWTGASVNEVLQMWPLFTLNRFSVANLLTLEKYTSPMSKTKTLDDWYIYCKFWLDQSYQSNVSTVNF